MDLYHVHSQRFYRLTHLIQGRRRETFAYDEVIKGYLYYGINLTCSNDMNLKRAQMISR